jgi:hypothetical protein
MAENPTGRKESRKMERVRTPPSRRIETQIHRRSKAKAVFPLQDEWEIDAGGVPELRMPSAKMRKTKGEPSSS